MITILTFENPDPLINSLEGITRVNSSFAGVHLKKVELYFKSGFQEKALKIILKSEIVKGYSTDRNSIEVL